VIPWKATAELHLETHEKRIPERQILFSEADTPVNMNVEESFSEFWYGDLVLFTLNSCLLEWRKGLTNE
jgi:hypothetical protein